MAAPDDGRGDRLVGRLVAAGWAGLTLAAFAFVRRYGRDLPGWEEWYAVPAVFGPGRYAWVFERLQEHRYVLGRAVWLAGFELSGHDFRAGMYLTAVLLAAAAGLVARTAADLRGWSHPADLLPAALLLSPAGYENLILGYQVAFGLDVALACGLARVAALADRRPPAATARRAGVLLALLSLGGWIGLAFVPPGLVWVGWLVARRRAPAVALAPPLAAAGWLGWCLWELLARPLGGLPHNPPGVAARVLTEFLATGFGPFGLSWWPVSGWLAGGLTVATVAVLAWRAWRDPGRRASTLGLLVVAAGVLLMGAALARARPNGFAPRNLHLTAVLVAVAHLAAVRWWPPAIVGRWRLTAVLAVAVAGLVAYRGWRAGERGARPFIEWADEFDRDRRAGLPLPYLASRHRLFPVPDFAAAVRGLRDAGHPAAAGIPDGPAVTAEPLPVPARSAAGWRFDLGRERRLVGVRVTVQFHGHGLRERLRLRADGGPGAECSGWLIPFEWTFDFWLDAPARVLTLEPVGEASRFDLLSAELLLPAGGG